MHRYSAALPWVICSLLLLILLIIPPIGYFSDRNPFAANKFKSTKAINSMAVGTPEIISVTPEVVRQAGGQEVVINGNNFTPETQLVLGDSPVTDFVIESATTIRLLAPKQRFLGDRKLTVRTKYGLVQ